MRCQVYFSLSNSLEKGKYTNLKCEWLFLCVCFLNWHIIHNLVCLKKLPLKHLDQQMFSKCLTGTKYFQWKVVNISGIQRRWMCARGGRNIKSCISCAVGTSSAPRPLNWVRKNFIKKKSEGEPHMKKKGPRAQVYFQMSSYEDLLKSSFRTILSVKLEKINKTDSYSNSCIYLTWIYHFLRV